MQRETRPQASARRRRPAGAPELPRTILGQRRRAKLLDVAEREFLAKGYTGASLNAIVAAAGGSKSSITQYFTNKAGLFAAVIENRATALVQVLEKHSHEGAPREILQRLGVDLLTYMLRPAPLMSRRGICAIGFQHPELPEVFFGVGHAPLVAYMTRLLEQWRARGLVQCASPAWAAGTFLHLLAGGLHEQLLVGLKQQFTAAEVEAEVRGVVEFFWRAVAATPGR